MRKPVYAICEQQRRRSACASAQSDQRLYCSLPRYKYNTSSFYIQNFKPLANLITCCEKILCVHFDNNLEWTNHFQHVCKKILCNLWFLFTA